VLIADVEGRICQSTEEVSRILKLDEPARTDLYGNLLGWWDGAGRMIQEGGPLPRALGEGRSSRSEPITVQCMDGSIVTIIASAAPLHGVDGRIAGAVVLIKDITEPKKIEEALEERVTRLIGAGLERDASSVRPR
jgi:PAS domain-containing protein